MFGRLSLLLAVPAFLGCLAVPLHQEPQSGTLNSPFVAAGKFAEVGLVLAVRGDSWAVSVNEDLWFDGKGVTIFDNMVQLTSADGSLNLSDSSQMSGTDALGPYSSNRLTWTTPTGKELITTFRVYLNHATIIFEQLFVSAFSNPGFGRDTRDHVMSSFPSISVGDHNVTKGFLQFKGDMIGRNPSLGRWHSNTTLLGSGLNETAPLVVFDSAANVACVWSAASNFMAVNQQFESATLRYGIMGSATAVPAGLSMSVMLHCDSGINKAIASWGETLRQNYGKDRARTESDFGLNYLGYSTDNGAYYYYLTEPGKNYQDTLIDVKARYVAANLPVRHVLLDSWWYYQGFNGGVKTWEPRPDIFPNGLAYLYNVTHWPSVAHNRYWAKDTTYARQNGGEWDFILDQDTGFALPTQQEFWDWLLEKSRNWGMMTYEQDWLYNEFEGLTALLTNVTLGRTWLMQMGAAAEKNGLTIQYCMAFSRHILQSVEIPAVTQARASDDYHPGNGQWDTSLTAMVAHALALRPSKDNWWSSRNQSWKDQGKDVETRNRMQGLTALLSRGPYTPGDKIGAEDVDLIMKGCTAAGRLLHPDRPATAIDANILKRAGFEGPSGVVLSTETTINGLAWHYVVAIDSDAFALTLSHLGADSDATFVAFENNATDVLKPLSVSAPIAVPASTQWAFQFWTIAPQLPNGWYLLGEVSKWVSVSQYRIVHLDSEDGGLVALLRGAQGESVSFRFASPTLQLIDVTCTIGSGGVARVHVTALGGTCF